MNRRSELFSKLLGKALDDSLLLKDFLCPPKNLLHWFSVYFFLRRRGFAESRGLFLRPTAFRATAFGNSDKKGFVIWIPGRGWKRGVGEGKGWGGVGEELGSDLGCPFPPSASASFFCCCFFPQRVFPWRCMKRKLT